MRRIMSSTSLVDPYIVLLISDLYYYQPRNLWPAVMEYIISFNKLGNLNYPPGNIKRQQALHKDISEE